MVLRTIHIDKVSISPAAQNYRPGIDPAKQRGAQYDNDLVGHSR